MLLKHGALANEARSTNDETLTQACVAMDHAEALAALVRGGASLALGTVISTRFESEPLAVLAAMCGALKCLRYLLDNGVRERAARLPLSQVRVAHGPRSQSDPNASSKYSTCLTNALRARDPEGAIATVRLLLEVGTRLTGAHTLCVAAAQGGCQHAIPQRRYRSARGREQAAAADRASAPRCRVGLRSLALRCPAMTNGRGY